MAAILIDRLTGMDKPTMQWGIGGTDLGIPYLNEDGSATNFLFGDTFLHDAGSENWRSPAGLWSDSDPKLGPIRWNGAMGGGISRQLMEYQHITDNRFGSEFTRIPNSGISFKAGERGPGTPAAQYISFHSVNSWPAGQPWRSNYSALAVSTDGGSSFKPIAGGRRNNRLQNDDPFQMVAMVKDPDGFVYLFSVRCGRQYGPMMLRRVRWGQMWNDAAYQEWGYRDGKWAWGNPCTGILWGNFGEPGAVRLADGEYVLTNLVLDEGLPKIVSRHAPRPDAVWSNPKVQLTSNDQGYLYGGFPHPLSTRDSLNMMVSTWGPAPDGVRRYDVSQWRGSI